MAYVVRFGKVVRSHSVERNGRTVRFVKQDTFIEERDKKAKKGVFGQNCNVTDCQKPVASWYNHVMQKYYCQGCALEINRWNRDYKEDNGHEICTPGKAELEEAAHL